MEELLFPIFPLELVLLPEEPLPLHIFEERYKEMIGECLAAQAAEPLKKQFGIVLGKDSEIEPVGCSARIVNVTRKYDGGQMDILTVGVQRFEILYTEETRAFLRAGVTFFEDDAGRDTPGEKEAAEAIELFRRAQQRLHHAEEMPIHLPRPYRHLSFRIAGALPLELAFKQQLLLLRDEPTRLRQVVELIQELLARLDAVETARKRAGGNGHALNH